MKTALLILLMLCSQAQCETLRLGSKRFWHQGGVDCVCFSPDGKRVATGGIDGVKIWRLSDGKELARNNLTHVKSVIFTRDGKRLIVGIGRLFGRHSIVVCDERARVIRQWTVSDYEGVDPIILNATESKLLIAGGPTKPRWRNWQTGKLIRMLTRRRGHVFAISPDGQSVIAYGQPGLCWRRLNDGRLLQRWHHESNGYLFAAFSADGRLVASCDNGSTVQIRNLAQRTSRFLQTDAGEIVHVCFSPDGKYLSASLESGERLLWNVQTGKMFRRFTSRSGYPNRSAFSPDGKMLACTGDKLTLWDVATGKEILKSSGHRDAVQDVICSPDGRLLISRANDNSVRVWNLKTGEEVKRFRSDNLWYGGRLSIAPKGHLSWCDSRTVRTVELQSLHEKNPQKLCWPLSAITTSTDRRWVIGFSHLDGVLVWNRESMCLHRELKSKYPGWKISLSPDGAYLALLTGDVEIVSCKSWKKVRQIQNVYENRGGDGEVLSTLWLPISSFAWSPQSNQILTTCERFRRARLRALEGKKTIVTFENCTATAFLNSFSPTGRMVVLNGDDALELWEVATGLLRARWRGHEGGIASICFTPDGRKLITGGFDSTILIRDLYPPEKSNRSLDSLWELLADDAQKSFRAMCQMMHRKKETLSFLAKNLKPTPKLSEQAIMRLIRQLDSANLAIRTKARERLEELDQSAEPVLRKMLTQRPTLTLRRRILTLLARLKWVSWKRARPLRAIEILEQLGTNQSRKLLRRLATGGVSETARQAKLALMRMEKVGEE